MRVPVYERQVGISPMPGARVNAPGGAEAYGAGVGAAVHDMGNRISAIAQDMEDARTLELFNAFKRESAEYHEHPDKGLYNTRVGFGAWNATKDADTWLEGKANEYAKKAPGARAKQNFMRMAGQHREQMRYANSRFEAGQIKKYRDAEADAAIQNGLDGIAANYADDAAVEQIKLGLAEAIELKTRGMGPEARNAALAELDNRAAMTRLTIMLQQNPMEAKAWFEGHRDSFTGAVAAKAEETVKKAAEIYKIQGIADRLILDYPQGDEEALYKYVREHYAGEEEEKILSAVKSRVNERKIIEGAEETALRKAQKGNYDNYVAGMVNGVFPTAEQIALDVDSGKLDPSHGWQLENMITTQATAAGTRKRLARDIPGWNSMESWKQDELVMRNMPDGPTKAEHEAMMYHLKDIALSSDVTDEEFKGEVKSALSNMRITRHEADEFLGVRKKLEKEQKEFVSNVRGDLRANLSQLFNNKKGQPGVTSAAVAYFNEAVTQLDPNSSTYRKDVLSAMKDAMVKGVEVSGRNLEQAGDWYLLWMNGGTTKFGERYNELIGPIDTRIANTPEYEPRFVMDNLDLPEKRNGTPSLTGNTGHVGQDFVGGGGTTVKNGEYLATGGRSKPHGGQDLAKPAGTPVTVPAQLEGVEMKVSGVGKDARSGNKLHLKGKASGHKFDIFMCHFKDDSIAVKNGDAVTAGTVLAKVGSTGHSSGPHLHIETKIDGKRVDPAKFYEILGLKPQETKTEQPQQQVPQTPQAAQPPVSGDRKPTVEECLFGAPGRDFQIGGMF